MAGTGDSSTLVLLARRFPLSLIGLGVALYSTGMVFVAASEVSGQVFAFWRLWLGVAVLAVVTWISVRAGTPWPSPRSAEGRHAWRYAGYAGTAFAAQQLTFFIALRTTSVTDVALMNTLLPIVVGIVAVPLFGERPGAAFRLWTVLAMGGAAVVVLGASAGPDGQPLGMALALANVVFYAAFFLVSKQSRGAIPTLPFLLGVTLVAAVAVTLFDLATGAPIGAVSQRDVAFAFVVAAGPGVLGHFVMTWPLRWVPANLPPVMRLAQPIIGGLLAWAWLSQPVTAAQLGGGALTLAGVAGALRSRGGRALRRTAREGRSEDSPTGTPGGVDKE